MPTITITADYDGEIRKSGASYVKDDTDVNDSVGYLSKGAWQYRAYRRFPLTNLPAGVVVSKVRLKVNVTSAGGADHLTDIHPYNSDGQADPSADADATLFTRCAAGTEYVNNSTALRATGVKWFDLGSQACTDVASAKSAVNRFSVGLHEEGDDSTLAGIQAIEAEGTTTQLEVTYSWFKQGHFKWYREGWKTEDAQLTNVQIHDELRFRVCIHEILSQARSDLDIDVEYSTDKVTWTSLANYNVITDKFRWRNDPNLTDKGAIDQARLSCTTENGLIHKDDCVDCENVGADKHHEVSIILQDFLGTAGTVYYFRLVVEGEGLILDSEVSEYVNCEIATIEIRQGHFKWYKNSWKSQDEKLLYVQNENALRFRVCIQDTVGVTHSNLDINVQYSTNKVDWYDLGSQGATDKVFRWRNDPALTDKGLCDQYRLSPTYPAGGNSGFAQSLGCIHESSCNNCEGIANHTHREISIILEPYNVVNGTTYYFRVVVEGTALQLGVEATEYAYCEANPQPAAGYSYSDGLVTIMVT